MMTGLQDCGRNSREEHDDSSHRHAAEPSNIGVHRPSLPTERINASGLEGVNRPAKQIQPISARFCPDPETFGFSLEPPRKCT
jgi:hypothetical protein